MKSLVKYAVIALAAVGATDLVKDYKSKKESISDTAGRPTSTSNINLN